MPTRALPLVPCAAPVLVLIQSIRLNDRPPRSNKIRRPGTANEGGHAMTTTIRIIAALMALLIAGASHAQTAPPNYPTRQVRVIVAYPPGGPTDVIARLVAQKLTEQSRAKLLCRKPAWRGRRHRRRHRRQCAAGRTHTLHHDQRFRRRGHHQQAELRSDQEFRPDQRSWRHPRRSSSSILRSPRRACRTWPRSRRPSPASTATPA